MPTETFSTKAQVSVFAAKSSFTALKRRKFLRNFYSRATRLRFVCRTSVYSGVCFCVMGFKKQESVLKLQNLYCIQVQTTEVEWGAHLPSATTKRIKLVHQSFWFEEVTSFHTKLSDQMYKLIHFTGTKCRPLHHVYTKKLQKLCLILFAATSFVQAPLSSGGATFAAVCSRTTSLVLVTSP